MDVPVEHRDNSASSLRVDKDLAGIRDSHGMLPCRDDADERDSVEGLLLRALKINLG